ncbi:hypothetical protein WEI85_32930 [Actinomycetes bacterium KLBMP 9797]
MKRVLAAVIAGVVAAVTLGAAPALANDYYYAVHNTGAELRFYDDGDVFRLRDESCDGKGVHGYWYIADTGQQGWMDNSDGCGSSKKFASVNLPEGHYIDIAVWRTGDDPKWGYGWTG